MSSNYHYPAINEEWQLPQKLYEELQLAYPDLSIMGELSKMRIWLLANSSNRKTTNGLPRFINNWLAKAQNSPRTTGGNTHGNIYTKPRKIDQIRDANKEALAILSGMDTQSFFSSGGTKPGDAAGRVIEGVHGSPVARDTSGDW